MGNVAEHEHDHDEQSGIVNPSLSVRLNHHHKASAKRVQDRKSNKNENIKQEHVLRSEQSPPALNATKLRILPRLIEILKEEVSGAVRVGLADEVIEEDLEVIDRGRRRAVALVTRIGRVLYTRIHNAYSISTHSIPLVKTINQRQVKVKKTHRRPPRLRNIHLRRIPQALRKLHIILLEKLPSPPRALLHAHIREPRMNVRHPVVHRREHLVVEVRPRVRVSDRDGHVQREVADRRDRVLDVREQDLSALVADVAVRVGAAAVGA